MLLKEIKHYVNFQPHIKYSGPWYFLPMLTFNPQNRSIKCTCLCCTCRKSHHQENKNMKVLCGVFHIIPRNIVSPYE